MKTLLAKFYKSLALRVAWALVATATVANAHDLPQHFPLAPTDWGMIQQDCIGYQAPGNIAFDIDSEAASNKQFAEIVVAQPDSGNPPEPQISTAQLVSSELIGPALYDGVDCSKLESFYRNSQSEQLATQLVEYKNAEPAPLVVTQLPEVDKEFEFHKSFFAACSCDFENRQSNQSITPPKFALKRTYIEDHFANEFNNLKPLVLRDLSRPQFIDSAIEPLAIAIPINRVQNKHLLAEAFSQLASYDCIARSELYSSHRAFQFGEFAGSLSKSWFTDALPSASRIVSEYVRNLKPAQTPTTTPAPMFVIFETAAGNQVAIPIAQAKDWEKSSQETQVAQKAVVSQEFRDLVDTANSRLQWAGGRLSEAASYMNDWFSDRLARGKANDLR